MRLFALMTAGLVTGAVADPPPDAGQLAWVRSSLSTGSGTAEVRAITTDAQDNAYVVGKFVGTVNLFGTTLTAAFSTVPSGFLAKFSKDGVPLFVKKIGSNGFTELYAVAVKPDGGIFVGGAVAGTFSSGPVNFTVPSSTNGQDAFLLELDAAGDAVWGEHYGGLSTDTVLSLSVAPDNHLALAGNFQNSISLGGSTFTTRGARDSYVARLGPNREFYDIRQIAGTQSDAMQMVETDGTNHLLVGLLFQNNVELGKTPGQTPVSGTSNSFVLAKFALNSETPLWYRSFSSTSGLAIRNAVANTSDDSVVIGCQYGQAINFGGAEDLPAAASVAGFLVKFDKNGQFLWQKSLGGTDSGGDFISNIVVSRSGALGVVGRFSSGLPAEGDLPPLPANGQANPYLAMFTPSGQYLWRRLAYGSASGFGYQVAATRESDFIFAGFSGYGDFGSGPIPSGSANKEAFVAYYPGFSGFDPDDPQTEEQWRQSHFTVDQLGHPELIESDRDPDADGMDNFFEYLSGQSPLRRDTPPSLIVPAAPGDLIFTFHRNPYVSGRSFQVEWSDSMAPGEWHRAGVVETILDPLANPQPVECTIPRGADKRFVRLKVIKP